MNKKTRRALENSIRHWRTNLRRAKEGARLNVDGKSCALCKAFRSLDCYGCPVSTASKRMNCAGTPYEDVILYRHSPYKKRVVRAVRAELDFLVLLRPARARAKESRP